MYKRKDVYELRPSQMSQGRPWSRLDIEIVRHLAGKAKPKTIARILDRTYESVRQLAKREGIALKHIHDDIRVGGIILPYIHERHGWLKPDGKVTRNPIIAQRVAERENTRRGNTPQPKA